MPQEVQVSHNLFAVVPYTVTNNIHLTSCHAHPIENTYSHSGIGHF